MNAKREKFLDELQKIEFKPEILAGKKSVVLRYVTAFYLEGDYHKQVLSSLHDLKKLIEVDIEKVEGM